MEPEPCLRGREGDPGDLPDERLGVALQAGADPLGLPDTDLDEVPLRQVPGRTDPRRNRCEQFRFAGVRVAGRPVGDLGGGEAEAEGRHRGGVYGGEPRALRAAGPGRYRECVPPDATPGRLLVTIVLAALVSAGCGDRERATFPNSPVGRFERLPTWSGGLHVTIEIRSDLTLRYDWNSPGGPASKRGHLEGTWRRPTPAEGESEGTWYFFMNQQPAVHHAALWIPKEWTPIQRKPFEPGWQFPMVDEDTSTLTDTLSLVAPAK